MKFCSRETLGIVVGGISFVFVTILFIYIIMLIGAIADLSEEEKAKGSDILRSSVTLLYILLLVCLFSMCISMLLIVGIVKRRYTLMRPWICGAIAGIIFYILRIIISVIVGFTTGLSFATIIAIILVGLLSLGLQMLIVYPIYTLYTDIRDATDEQEQRGLNDVAQNPPTYGELEKGGEMYN